MLEFRIFPPLKLGIFNFSTFKKSMLYIMDIQYMIFEFPAFFYKFFRSSQESPLEGPCETVENATWKKLECAQFFFQFCKSPLDNKSVFEQESQLCFFVLARPLSLYNGCVTAWPNQSRVENNREKKARIFSGVKKKEEKE